MPIDKKITLGFTWAEGDRYSQAICELHPRAAALAAIHEGRPFHYVPEEVKALFKARVLYWYNRIPVRICPVAEEPYDDLASMQKDIRENKLMRVRSRTHGPIIGHAFTFWRAVHDYYGHALHSNPFSLSGELDAYAVHSSGQFAFPDLCHPFIRSNVVLENAFRLNRGHFLCYPNSPHCPSKVVFDDTFFGPEAEWYAGARGGMR